MYGKKKEGVAEEERVNGREEHSCRQTKKYTGMKGGKDTKK